MKLKLVKKLLITTMAMTMVVGMSVTALAGSSGGSVSGNVMTEEERSEAIAQAVREQIKAEESMSVDSFSSAGAMNTVPSEVKDTMATGNVYNLSKLTTTQGFIAAVNKIAEANAAATSVTLYSSTPIAFNTNSVTALSNANKEFVYMFKHDGHLYKVTIPAGAKVDLQGNRFAGPLYIGAQLGTSAIVK